MRILIVSGNPYIPQFTGGVESSTHELATELQQRGHHAAVLSGLTAGGGLASQAIRILRKASRQSFPADRWLGYPVYRQWDVLKSVPTAVKEIAPDVAIMQIGDAVPLAHALELSGVPVLFYLRNVELVELCGDPRTLSNVQFIANSAFTARRYKELLGLESIVIPPLFRAERYIARRRPANVTFINPNVDKGLEIAFKIAERCPEIPFSFFESWPMPPQDFEDLRRRLAVLPNVTLRHRTNDMKNVYSKAKIVLAPSVWEEAWGRIATEAHFSGIPVVASNLGGLPESVGPGGVLLDPKGPIEPWVAAIKRLWTDDSFYREKSAAALAYSKRAEIGPAGQIDALLAAAALVLSRAPATVKPAGSPLTTASAAQRA